MAATDFDPVFRSRLELIGAPRPRLHLSVERFFRKGYIASVFKEYESPEGNREVVPGIHLKKNCMAL
jgi:hypothetical protein